MEGVAGDPAAVVSEAAALGGPVAAAAGVVGLVVGALASDSVAGEAEVAGLAEDQGSETGLGGPQIADWQVVTAAAAASVGAVVLPAVAAAGAGLAVAGLVAEPAWLAGLAGDSAIAAGSSALVALAGRLAVANDGSAARPVAAVVVEERADGPASDYGGDASLRPS